MKVISLFSGCGGLDMGFEIPTENVRGMSVRRHSEGKRDLC